MKIEIKNEKIEEVVRLHKEKILRVNEEYQRGAVWNKHQCKMFIDSLMRDYKAPVFYFHKKKVGGGSYTNTFIDIVDGQQRINAIISYINGALELLDPSVEGAFKFPNFLENSETPWGGKRFDDLAEDHKKSFLKHELVIYEITTDDENEVRDLFIRLQAGTPLTPQDKRDAWPGNFTAFVLRVGGKTSQDNLWFGWPLFTEKYNKKREADRRQLAAQAFMLYWTKSYEKRFCDISSKNLDEFYHQQIAFDERCEESREFEKICKALNEEFRGHSKLVGHHLLHLVLLVGDLRADYSPHWHGRLADALGEFKSRCEEGKEANDAGDNESEFYKYYTEYGQWTRSSSDIAATIQRRHLFFHEKMVEILGAARKDPRRAFSPSDKELIFYRDGRLCQYCEMEREFNPTAISPHHVAWDHAEIHHAIPHRDGGKTILANGALVHKECHPKAREAEEEFKAWWNARGRTGSIPSEKRGRKTRTSKSKELPSDGTMLRISPHQAKYRDIDVKGEIKGRKVVISGEVEGTFKTLSPAANEITGHRTNGWDFWELKAPDSDRWILATDWRNQDD